MEAKMQLKQLRRLAQKLEECERQLSSNIRRLDAVCENCDSHMIERKLAIQSSFLKKQASLWKDMAAVSEQAVHLYEKTEESVIQAAEAETRQYEETLRVVSLLDMEQIPVTLQEENGGQKNSLHI